MTPQEKLLMKLCSSDHTWEEAGLLLDTTLFFSPDLKDDAGNSPLHKIAAKVSYKADNWDAVAEKLVARGFSLEAKNVAGQTPLALALAAGSKRTVAWASGKGKLRLSGYSDPKAMWNSVLESQEENLLLGIEEGGDPAARLWDFDESIFFAVRKPSIARILVDHGWSPSVVSKTGESAFSRVALRQSDNESKKQTLEIMRAASSDMERAKVFFSFVSAKHSKDALLKDDFSSVWKACGIEPVPEVVDYLHSSFIASSIFDGLVWLGQRKGFGFDEKSMMKNVLPLMSSSPITEKERKKKWNALDKSVSSVSWTEQGRSEMKSLMSCWFADNGIPSDMFRMSEKTMRVLFPDLSVLSGLVSGILEKECSQPSPVMKALFTDFAVAVQSAPHMEAGKFSVFSPEEIGKLSVWYALNLSSRSLESSVETVSKIHFEMLSECPRSFSVLTMGLMMELGRRPMHSAEFEKLKSDVQKSLLTEKTKPSPQRADRASV